MTRRLTLTDAMMLPRGQHLSWAYNAVDVIATRQVADVLLPRMVGRIGTTYAAERAYQSPAFTIMRRGILVDQRRRKAVLDELGAEADQRLREVAEAVPEWDGTEIESGACPKTKRKDGRHSWPRGVPDSERQCECCGAPRVRQAPLNANSTDQVLHLLRDLWRLPERVLTVKGKVGVGEEVLVRVAKRYPRRAPVVNTILRVRELRKRIGFVKSELSAAGRFHQSLNIGATAFGRSSSSKSPMGIGGNCQNVAERERAMFIADPGWELAQVDLSRAESRVVAHLADDAAYIEAHETDTHTYVARLLWPALPWTGDIGQDRKIAEGSGPDWDKAPGHNWRFQAKRVQHGSNYGLTPRGMAALAHIPVRAAEAVQAKYFAAFPGIRDVFQAEVRARLEEGLPLVTPVGREIELLGRPWDQSTHRQGYSAVPQSTVVEITHLAMFWLWRHHDFPGAAPEIQLLGEIHDALLLQWRPEDRDRAVAAVLEAFNLAIATKGRRFVIPVDVAIGQNWAKFNKDTNPAGLREV